MQTRFPKVLLLGNGINRSFSGDSWEELLRRININERIPDNQVVELKSPMPLKAILLTNDHIDHTMKHIHRDLYGEISNAEQKELLQRLLGLGFDFILTTNYSYELEEAAMNNTTISDYRLDLMSTHTSVVKEVDKKYLLHSFNQFGYRGVPKNVWHVHGEAKKPSSIIIGHAYYGELFARISAYLKSQKNRYYDNQREGKENAIRSWIDAFILGDVYAIGFGYDYSEFDLWWLLNRKKRENAEHGRLYFYEPQKVANGSVDEKVELLRTLGAEIESLGFSVYGKDHAACNAEYKRFYQAVCDSLESLIGK